MKKLRKKKKDSKKPTDAQVRRNRLLFGACAIGVFIAAFGIIYGYTALSTGWQESKALKQIQSELEDERVLGMSLLARTRLFAHTPKLCRMLHEDESVEVRKAAPLALAALNDNQAMPCLIYALGDDSDAVADAVMQGLHKMTDERMTWENVLDWWGAHATEYVGNACSHSEGVPVVDAMERMLESEKHYVRFAAVRRLSLLRHAATRPLLEKAAGDPHEKVRKAAAQALEQL